MNIFPPTYGSKPVKLTCPLFVSAQFGCSETVLCKTQGFEPGADVNVPGSTADGL